MGTLDHLAGFAKEEQEKIAYIREGAIEEIAKLAELSPEKAEDLLRAYEVGGSRVLKGTDIDPYAMARLAVLQRKQANPAMTLGSNIGRVGGAIGGGLYGMKRWPSHPGTGLLLGSLAGHNLGYGAGGLIGLALQKKKPVEEARSEALRNIIALSKQAEVEVAFILDNVIEGIKKEAETHGIKITDEQALGIIKEAGLANIVQKLTKFRKVKGLPYHDTPLVKAFIAGSKVKAVPSTIAEKAIETAKNIPAAASGIAHRGVNKFVGKDLNMLRDLGKNISKLFQKTETIA